MEPEYEGPAPEPAADQVHPIIASTFCLFVFSLLFEDAAPGMIEPSTLAGGLFVGSTLLQPKICYRKPHPAVVCFGVFVLVALLISLLIRVQNPESINKRLFQFGYLVVLTWLFVNLMQYRRMLILGYATLAGACVTLALLQLSGIAARSWGQGVGERITAFGFHPNQLALDLALGMLCIIGLSGYEHIRKKLPPLLMWPLIGILTAAIVETGSRGGLLALAAGLLFFCLQPGNARQRLNAIMMTVIGAVFVVVLVMANPSTLSRFEATVNEGHLSRRDLIYPIAIEMIEEKPITGWAVSENTFELGARFNEPGTPTKDTHNLALYVLTSTGILGAIPFFLGMWLTTVAAWKARRGSSGIAPFSLLMCTLVAAVGLSLIHTKIFWLVIAFCIAAALVDRNNEQS